MRGINSLARHQTDGARAALATTAGSEEWSPAGAWDQLGVVLDNTSQNVALVQPLTVLYVPNGDASKRVPIPAMGALVGAAIPCRRGVESVNSSERNLRRLRSLVARRAS